MATWKKIIVSGSNISQLVNDSNLIYSNSADVNLTGSFTGSFIGDGSGLSGVTAAGTLSSSAQIADDISGSLSAAHLNSKISGIISGAAQLPAGTVSGSSQVNADSITNFDTNVVAGLPSGTISGSSQVNADSITNFDTNVVAGLPANTVSGSAQTIANLPSGTISGSAQVNADTITNFDTNVKAKLTAEGVISSSAQIDGDFINTTGDGVFSGSAQVNADSITNFDANVKAKNDADGVISGSSQVDADSITNFDTNVVAGLPTGTVSGSAQTIANLPSGTVSGSAQVTLQDADKTGFTGAASITTLGTVVAGNVAAILPSGVVSGSGQITDGSNTISSSAQLADDISGSFSAAHLNSKVAGVVSASAEGSAQGTIALNGVDVNVNGLQTGDSPTLTGLTLTGNLEVQGTTTTVDSTTVSFADNIISLNGTGATNGGIEVNDANGPASGSLIWDGTANQWKAGAQGSEAKVLTKGGDDSLVSGSGQVKDLLPAGTVSGSAQSIANLATSGIVSGAAQINALTLDAGGAFSGSFQGDGSGLTGVTAAGTLSSSAQIADDISGSLSAAHLNAKIAGIVSGAAQTVAHLPAGTVSGSAQTVANLSNQDVNLGTGDITGVSASFGYVGTAATVLTGSFVGDGSELTNLTVDQVATITSTFTNATTASITHNFGSRNVIVSVYDSNNEQIIPSTVKLDSVNSAEVHFGTTSTGTVIVAQGGHLVSGSIPFSNIIALPSLVSSSAQIADDISGSLSSAAIAALGSGIISSSTQIDTDLFDIDGLVSGSSQVTALLPAGTISGSAQVDADTVTNFDTNVKAKNDADGVISGSVQVNADTITNFDTNVKAKMDADTVISGAAQINGLTLNAGGAFSGSFQGDGSGLTGVSAAGTLSSSAQIADDISGSFSAAHLNAKVAGIVSGSSIATTGQGEVQLTTNGVAATTVDLGLQTTDSPTFAGLTVSGDLTVTGDTIEAQVTNLNIEDKYILLNSGSTSGDSGIVFGGADGAANSGVGLFWDTSYNTNDGRLGIVNSIAAGATGDQTPSYHIAGVFEGTEGNAATAQADHVGNIRVESDDIYIYV